jgi:hypothetical protein
MKGGNLPENSIPIFLCTSCKIIQLHVFSLLGPVWTCAKNLVPTSILFIFFLLTTLPRYKICLFTYRSIGTGSQFPYFQFTRYSLNRCSHKRFPDSPTVTPPAQISPRPLLLSQATHLPSAYGKPYTSTFLPITLLASGPRT